MAGNTRGKLKEQFEGIHNNNNWALNHIEKSLLLIQDHNPALSESMGTLAEGYKALDDVAQAIYGQL